MCRSRYTFYALSLCLYRENISPASCLPSNSLQPGTFLNIPTNIGLVKPSLHTSHSYLLGCCDIMLYTETSVHPFLAEMKEAICNFNGALDNKTHNTMLFRAMIGHYYWFPPHYMYHSSDWQIIYQTRVRFMLTHMTGSCYNHYIKLLSPLRYCIGYFMFCIVTCW